MKKIKVPGSGIFGLILIIIGVISLLGELGYLDINMSFSVFWPVAIILIGVKLIVDYRSNTFFGIIVTVVGALFLLDNLEIFYFDNISIREIIVPIIIILVGLSFVLPKRKKESTAIVEEGIPVVNESVPVQAPIDINTDTNSVIPPTTEEDTL